MRIQLSLVLLLAACGGGDDDSSADTDAAVETDAPAPVYEAHRCVPGAVADPLVIGGTITAFEMGPADGATVQVIRESDGSVLASATTDASGNYTLPGIATGGAPIAGYMQVSKSGFSTRRLYTVDGIRHATATWPIFAPGNSVDAEVAALGVTPDPARGVVAVYAQACNARGGAGLNGAVVQIIPMGTRTYYVDADGLWDPDQPSTRAPSGEATTFNVPPGDATIELRYQDHLTAAHVGVAADTITSILYYP
jgi:hypothetical protein